MVLNKYSEKVLHPKAVMLVLFVCVCVRETDFFAPVSGGHQGDRMRVGMLPNPRMPFFLLVSQGPPELSGLPPPTMYISFLSMYIEQVAYISLRQKNRHNTRNLKFFFL